METELKSLLEELLARQAAIYQKLAMLDEKLRGKSVFRSEQSYFDDLEREAERFRGL